MVESVSFALRNQSTTENVRVALEFGAGNWAVATDIFNNASNAVWSNLSLDVASASWNTLNFVPSTTLSLGASATLPSGDLTGIGFYLTDITANSQVRIDTVSVNAIPEPSTAAFLGFGLLALVLRARRN